MLMSRHLSDFIIYCNIDFRSSIFVSLLLMRLSIMVTLSNGVINRQTLGKLMMLQSMMSLTCCKHSAAVVRTSLNHQNYRIKRGSRIPLSRP